MNNNIREELIAILDLELENNEISQALFEGLLVNEKCFGLSFYEPPIIETDTIPELKYLDKKIDRLKDTIAILEKGLNELKSRVLKLDEMTLEHDVYAYTSKVRGIGIRGRRFGNEIQSLLGQSSADLKQVTKNIPRPHFWSAPYFYHCDNGITKVESAIRCTDVVAYQVPHFSILKTSCIDRIKYFSSFRLASKVGHGTSSIAKITDGNLEVIRSGQTWIS